MRFLPHHLSLLAAIMLPFSGCSAPADIHDTRFMMGTLVEFTVSGMPEKAAEEAIGDAAAEMQRVEDAFTIYGDVPNAVKTFNATPPNTAMTLPDEVSQLLELSLQIQKQSHGSFDPALGGENLLWGFSTDSPPVTPPAASAIHEAMAPPECIRHNGNQWLRSDRRCLLDFGGIAKGYAIDRGIAVLRSHHIENAIINAGGDIRLIGRHGNRPWKIGIRHPRKAGEVLLSLTMEGDKSIVTSGDYERFFMYNGKRYHHILDPQSGEAAMYSQSTTVIASTATLADAWSTALFIAPAPSLPAALQLIRVDASGHVYRSSQP